MTFFSLVCLLPLCLCWRFWVSVFTVCFSPSLSVSYASIYSASLSLSIPVSLPHVLLSLPPFSFASSLSLLFFACFLFLFSFLSLLFSSYFALSLSLSVPVFLFFFLFLCLLLSGTEKHGEDKRRCGTSGKACAASGDNSISKPSMLSRLSARS